MPTRGAVITEFCALPAGTRPLLVTPLLWLALTAPVHAGPLFSGHFLSFDAGPGARSVATGDLNADGRPDLAVTNQYPYTVSVLLGNGDGTLGVRTEFGVGTDPVSVAIADLNADGRSDLAVANSGSSPNFWGSVSVLLGNGDGTFAAKTDFGAGVHSRSVAIADLNADGRLDLAVANAGFSSDNSGTISVLLGNGDGGFGDKADFGTWSYSQSVTIADLNADTRPDLVVSNSGYSATVSVLLGYGDGTFGATTDLDTGMWPLSVAIADLDADGWPDLAVTHGGDCVDCPGTVSVQLGNGDGTFGGHTDYGVGIYPTSLAIADFNLDGRPDLAVTSDLDGGKVSVLPGNGNGTFGARKDFNAGGSTSATIEDFNVDGRPDVAVANGGSTVSVVLGNGDGTFGSQNDFCIGRGPRSVAIADLDADGRLDLAVANVWSNTVSVLLGNGDGTFRAKADFGTEEYPNSVAIADLNGDGRPDLAAATSGPFPYVSGGVSVLFGNGDGTFGTRTDIGTGSPPSSVAIADFNADGRQDLAVSRGFIVSVLLGNGDGTFGTRTDVVTDGGSTSLAIADINADGRPDLVVPNGSWVSVLLGHGDGTFAARTDIDAWPGPRSVTIADINADGRPDLAVPIGTWVSVLLGNGDGTFAARTDFSTGAGSSVAVADLNSDGRPDLAVLSNPVSVLLGNEDGTFGARAQIGTGVLPYALAIADLNGDGRPDLAVATANTFRDCCEPFGANSDAAGSLSSSVAIADRRAGRRPDLAANVDSSDCSPTDGRVSVLLNLGVTPGPLAMAFDLTPSTLNLASRGRWVTGLLEPATTAATGDIDVSSIRLNGTVPVDAAAPTALGDHNGDGVSDLMVKFNRAAVALTLSQGDQVPVVVTGTVDGHSFRGTDWIRVRGAGAAGSHQMAGESADETGDIEEATPGVGDREPAPLALALRGATPNPAVGGRLRVEFALPNGSPARLELMDVAGRVLTSRQVGTLGPGTHALELSPSGRLRPGIYFLRLTQGGSEIRTRAAMVR